MPESWNTKWGARRVRHDPPTLAEALAAAQGFTDDRDGQAEIAAGLMGVSVAEAQAELRRLTPERSAGATVVAAMRNKGSTRTVIVERRTSRRAQTTTRLTSGVSNPR